MNKNHRFFVFLLSFVMLVGVSLACGSEIAASEQPKISTATLQIGITQPPLITQPYTNTPMTTEASATDLYLGDAVQKNGYALTVLSVANPAMPTTYFVAEEGKKLVAVELLLSNVSGDFLNVSAGNAELIDSDGFLYPAENGVDNIIGTVDLNPGEQTRGWIGFIIPENATPAKIKFLTELFDFSNDTYIYASLQPPPDGHNKVTISITPTIPSSRLGDVVEQFGYSLSVSKVEDPTIPSGYDSPKEGYKLVAVEISLGNVSGSKPLSVVYYFASLVDNEGFVYDCEYGGRDGEIEMLDLNVGERAKGWVSFIIPDNATPSGIKYQLGFWSRDFLIAGLAK